MLVLTVDGKEHQFTDLDALKAHLLTLGIPEEKMLEMPIFKKWEGAPFHWGHNKVTYKVHYKDQAS